MNIHNVLFLKFKFTKKSAYSLKLFFLGFMKSNATAGVTLLA
ncbi:hypothetical protein FORMB_23260 [Formosa sp. Hel1_33_131]|nr:hypothetical protein FORMB_23260 [Formosa sp. Hel1_33_131]